MKCKGITRLRLSCFRSYQYTDLHINAKHIVLSGLNGAGKTNLLEAISFLSPGKGLRKAKLSEVASINITHPWAINAILNDDGTDLNIAVGQDPVNLSRRIVKVQTNPIQNNAELAHFLNVNWITPAMDRLFLEAGGLRRKFFDRLVYGLDPMHAESLLRYEQAMKERNRLLKERTTHTAWLDALERTMVQESIAIAVRRLEALDLLQQSQPALEMDDFPSATLKFVEGLEKDLNCENLIVEEEQLLERMAENRKIDALLGRTQVGAHKMDFTAVHGIKQLNAELCSTGEQKILLMWLVLAFVRLQTIKHGNIPSILLLDEVAAHLDTRRRLMLFEKLNTLDVQIWYSGTDLELFKELQSANTQTFLITDSHIKQLV